MTYVRIVPSLRTPFGVDVFDYAIEDGADVVPGDIISIPFRRQEIPGLVIGMAETTSVAGRIRTLSAPKRLLQLPPEACTLLERAAERTFCSQPSILHSWLGAIPKRFKGTVQPRLERRNNKKTTPTETSVWVVHRSAAIRRALETAHGRTLILSPWQHRAQMLGNALHAPMLHAERSMGSNWDAIQRFAATPDGVLVATRRGAWLACLADTVIIEEPENDDYKQDEQSPRLDARWIVDIASSLLPHLRVLDIGTTPPLRLIDRVAPGALAELAPEMEREPWAKGPRSVENVSERSLQEIEQAIEDKRPVVVVHPIRGERSRFVCRDCGWVALCPSCQFPISHDRQAARCRRCLKTTAFPVECPTCGSLDLSKSRGGRDRLAQILTERFPGANLRVVDLPSWHLAPPAPGSLVVLTDASLIGGAAEDIRRRERLIIAWRRFAATLVIMKCTALIQGPEETLASLPAWLTEDGLRAAWAQERRERDQFGFPLLAPPVKLLVDGTDIQADAFLSRLVTAFPDATIRGPFQVPYRSADQSTRYVFHLLPERNMAEKELISHLATFAPDAIIDLDPIAFFS